MSDTLTIDNAQLAEIEEAFQDVPVSEIDPADWPLGCQSTYLYSRTADRVVFTRTVLHPMEPFRSSTIKFRFDLGQLPPRSAAYAQSRGGKAWQLKEGQNEVSFPSKDAPLYLYVQSGGPVGSVVVVTSGEQRQC